MKPSDIKTVSELIGKIRQLWELKSYKALREFLAKIESEEDYYRLIRLAEAGSMYSYSHFLAVMANKRFQSVRTLSWYCYSLLEKGKSMEAETKMKRHLFDKDIDSLSVEEQKEAYLLLVWTMCQLHRYREADEYMERIKTAGGVLLPDQLAAFYMETNDWVQAEQEIVKGLNLPFDKRGDISYLVYADLLSRQGDHEKALHFLEKGAERFPDLPSLQLEQIRRLRNMGRSADVLENVERLNEENPFHANIDYFLYLKAEALYRLEKWDELRAWISQHEKVLQSTELGERTINPDGEYKELTIQPVRQKLNYCVPAALSMVLQTLGQKISQDEVAEYVFDVTGSKLMTAIDYMTSRGFTSKFFKGTIDLYKQFIDAGCPVMLDMLIENNSHVQVVVGYDDRLGVLLVQDPNEFEAVMVPYDEAAKTYRLKDRLSVVFVTTEQMHLLKPLDEKEHQFFQSMFVHLEEIEQNIEASIDSFLAFLENNDGEIFASILGLSIIQHEKAKPYQEKWIRHVMERFGDDDEDVQLLIAQSYYTHDQTGKEFQDVMDNVKKKNAYAHFLMGVVDYQKDKTEQAIFHLNRSLEKDPFQPSAYAYLARSYADFSQFQLARHHALTALEQAGTDEFTRSTYAIILLESGAVQEALHAFEQLSEEYPNNDYYVYEIGRCYMELGDKQASKWLKRALDMNPAIPYPYLRIAEIRMEEEKWERAEAYLCTGAEDFVPESKTGILWLYIGHTRMGRELYDHAEEAYDRAVRLDDDGELLAVVYKAQSIIKQDDWERAEQVIRAETRPDILVRAGAMMMEEAEREIQQSLALNFMEAGLTAGGDDLSEHVSMYVDYVEDTPFIHRAAVFSETLRARYPISDIYCYEAIFHEQMENMEIAEWLLLEAVELDPKSTFPHYRLGKLYRAIEEYEKAAFHLRRCIQLDHNFTAAHDELAHLYMETSDCNKGKRHLFHVLEQMPQSCDFDLFSEWMSTPAERQKVITQLGKLKGTTDEEWRLGTLADMLNIDEAIRLLKQEESVQLQAKLASLYLKAGNIKEALLLIEALIQKEPDNESLYEPWVEALYRSKKLLKVEKFVREMELLDEDTASIYRNSADVLVLYVREQMEKEHRGLLKKLTSGIKTAGLVGTVTAYYEKAIEFEPDDPRAYDRLAIFFIEQGVADDALKVLKRYLSNHDDDSLRFKAAAAAMSHGTESGKEKYIQEAKKHLLLLKERHPSDAVVREMLGDAYMYTRQPDDALTEYEELIEIAPYKTEGYAGIILVLIEIDKISEAKQFLNQVPDQIRDRVVVQFKEMLEGDPRMEELISHD
ncbi:hypothetical protein AWH48_19225 [Domibacillus aminovorans]|uniref:Peptidase C39-like domain-containing protein n=1 Tax=Domibacillus aminovorans TaxID=29332 RepID=A0A177KVK5_9BACI|nr:tetratricopeptide repeat protein [Domibacillus aminovorans]OAH57418.1 hypothetical protein AWH48_19225 [Domibacillus aminovorans]